MAAVCDFKDDIEITFAILRFFSPYSPFAFTLSFVYLLLYMKNVLTNASTRSVLRTDYWLSSEGKMMTDSVTTDWGHVWLIFPANY